MDRQGAHVQSLLSDYLNRQKILDRIDGRLILEKRKMQTITELRDSAQTILSDMQEEIDCDPLPENAQPLSRIQKRDIQALVSFNIYNFVTYFNILSFLAIATI